MATFRWENVGQFISLVNLLSLRNGGQLQPKDEKDDEDVGEDDYSLDAAFGGEDELKRKFLDSLAEVMSRDKGGNYVSCVALREWAVQDTEDSEKRITLFVSRNEPFKDVDRKFCKTLQKQLAVIGASVDQKSNDQQLEHVGEILWEDMLHYNKPRFEYYVRNFQKNLQAFNDKGLHEFIPLYEDIRTSSSQDEAARFCDDHQIGQYSEATHAAYMNYAQKQIVELGDIAKRLNQPGQLRILAEKAYSMRHMSSIKLLLDSCPNASLARKLFSDMLFLGRLMSCYATFIQAAKSVPGFSNLLIELVPSPSPRLPSSSSLLTVTDTFKLLAAPFDSSSVRKYVGPKMTDRGVEQEFQKLQRAMVGKPFVTHAEVQIILHLAKTASRDTLYREVFPYIGCSKLSCFLCSAFLRSFMPNDVQLKTRGSHGKIYRLWSVPDVDDLQHQMDAELHSTVKTMRNALVREIIKPVISMPHVAESSANVTVKHDERASHVSQYRNMLEAQREFDSMRSHWKRTRETPDVVEDPKTQDTTELDEPATPSDDYHQCYNCMKEASRRCSKCNGPWFCGDACEREYSDPKHNYRCSIGRPLTTADDLALACRENLFPEDPQTLMDFGFTKFTSASDHSRLLGLYIGLFEYRKVSAEDVHQWQVQGTLSENIISKFESIPERYRGNYYSWFRKNLHTFNSEIQGPDLDFLAKARPYLSDADKSKDPKDLTPDAKRKSFLLYALLLNDWTPGPDLGDDLFFAFGFCACAGSEESELHSLYQELMRRCSFKDFWTAFQSNSLISLLDKMGLHERRKRIKRLDTFLNLKPDGWCHTVWHLKCFVEKSDPSPPPQFVAVDYGFLNCETTKDMSDLKEVYKDLFGSWKLDLMELHAACITGKLYEFTSKHLPYIQGRFRKLMKNAYPLPIEADFAGMCAERVAIKVPDVGTAEMLRKFQKEFLGR